MYKNLAPASLVEPRDAERGDQALLVPLAFYGLERRAEGISAQDADPERRRAVRIGGARPLGEFGQVIREGGLDRVLAIGCRLGCTRRFGAGRAAGRRSQKQGQAVNEAPRSRSAAEAEIKRPTFAGVHGILRFGAEELTGLTPTGGHDSAEHPPR